MGFVISCAARKGVMIQVTAEFINFIRLTTIMYNARTMCRADK